jgi:hypothetical protein
MIATALPTRNPISGEWRQQSTASELTPAPGCAGGDFAVAKGSNVLKRPHDHNRHTDKFQMRARDCLGGSQYQKPDLGVASENSHF